MCVRARVRVCAVCVRVCACACVRVFLFVSHNPYAQAQTFFKAECTYK